ncbi:MAG TPA: hypothetical protein VJR50_00545 [Mycobacterium sp.]|nr:hypothetical protein [Mycobacterium sp.]
MSVVTIKKLSAIAGMIAFGTGVALDLGGSPTSALAGGSGDSSTIGEYTSPVVPAMSLNPTAMSLGATATASPAKQTEAIMEATPSVKASPAAGCVNNGQCP